MSDVLRFMGDSPFLTFFLALIAASVLKAIITLPFRFWNRWLRHRSIRERGWPTHPLMDADGDIVHPSSD